MPEQMKWLWRKFYSLTVGLFFLILCTGRVVFANDLYLEPVIQGQHIEEWIPAIEDKGKYFLNPQELAGILQVQLNAGSDMSGQFMGKPFKLEENAVPAGQRLILNGRMYLALPVYEKLWNIGLQVDPFEMQLKVSADRDLPVTIGQQISKRQQNFLPMSPPDSFENYDFDNRYWSSPVVDVAVGKNHSISDYNGAGERHMNSTSYQADFGMLAGGLDAYGSVFGDNTNEHYNPRARLTVGRTFLDEPRNKLNLVEFEAGDVTGFNSTLFNNSTSGRGAYASSFKDLVLSADKTIDLNGPLSDGWQVELYQNGQLIGFRQNGLAGRYQFANVPVSYGLNVFKLVFYGPYGEVVTEEREYYSGTSPVKRGEFGYTANAYQRDRYLFEGNEPSVNPSDKGTVDYTGYYGLNDELTLIGSMSTTPDVVTDEIRQFGAVGAQMAVAGASVQYNTLYGFENGAVGHHVDVQGNVYVGDIFARYDYYGDMRSPLSYYSDRYLKDIAEARLTGYIPGVSLPYYVSYLEGNDLEDNGKLQEARMRLSPSFWQYYNVSVENLWHKDDSEKYDEVILLLQAQFNRLGLRSQTRYRVDPSAYFSSFNQQADYRWNKYTYFQANWDHDCRSNYSDQNDLDTLSVSAGRLFDVGGLTLTMSVDTDRDAAIGLMYNLSLGKIPGRMQTFLNGQTKMSKRGTMYAMVEDEAGNPIPNAKVQVSGLQEPVVTDENGGALITDMEPYAKAIMKVDPSSIEDVALTPMEEEKKVVLRPGTVRPVKLLYVHKGGVEGLIECKGEPYKYRIELLNKEGKTVAVKTPDLDGSFIFDEIIFGEYTLAILTNSGEKIKEMPIKIEEAFYSINQPIEV